MLNEIKKWRSFLQTLKENKQLIREFTQKEKSQVMEDSDNFTISYEIELDARGNMMTGGRAEESEGDRLDRFMRDMDALEMLDHSVYDHYYGSDPVVAVIKYFMDNTNGIDVDEQSINLKAIPFYLGLEHAFMTGGSSALENSLGLAAGFKDREKIATFMQKAFKEELLESGYGILDDIETEIYEVDPRLQDDPDESIIERYKEDKLNPQQLEALMNAVSKLMPHIMKEYFIEATPFGVNEPNESYHKFPLSTFYSIFGKDTDYSMLYAIGYDVIDTLADPSGSMQDAVDELKDYRSKYRMSNTFLVQFLDFYIDFINSQAESYVEMLDQSGGGHSDDYPIDGGSFSDYQEAYRFALAEHMPRFYSRYGDDIKVESDSSLSGPETSLEFSMVDYLDSLEEALQFLDIFYDDYNDQNFFHMSDKTGLHMNIGYKTIQGENDFFNLVKGFMFLNELSPEGKAPRAMKGVDEYDWRRKRWAKPLATSGRANLFADRLAGEYTDPMTGDEMRKKGKDFVQKLNDEDAGMSDVEEAFSTQLQVQGRLIGAKSTGFNVAYADGRDGDEGIRYIEFRYPGGEITEEVAKDLTLYYCHIVKLMADKQYMKDEYIKKFIGLLNLTAEASLPYTQNLQNALRVGEIVYIDPPYDSGGFTYKSPEGRVHNYSNRPQDFSNNNLWDWLVNVVDGNYKVPRTKNIRNIPARVSKINMRTSPDGTRFPLFELEYYTVNEETGEIVKKTSTYNMPQMKVGFQEGTPNAQRNRTTKQIDQEFQVPGRESDFSKVYNAKTLKKQWDDIESLLSKNPGLKFDMQYRQFVKPSKAAASIEQAISKELSRLEKFQNPRHSFGRGEEEVDYDTRYAIKKDVRTKIRKLVSDNPMQAKEYFEYLSKIHHSDEIQNFKDHFIDPDAEADIAKDEIGQEIISMLGRYIPN